MSNIAGATVKFQTSDTVTPTAGAASFTVPCSGGADHRTLIVVDNSANDVIARVNVEAGDGERAVLGDLDVDVAVGDVGVIPLNDSMRFKIATTDSVTVNLFDTSDTDLTAGKLANMLCYYIQG